METTLYYTLSTVAQTVAGASAVLVTFVLFRLGHLTEAIGRVRGVLTQGMGLKYETAWPALRDHGPDAIRDMLADRPTHDMMRFAPDQPFWDACDAAHRAWQERSRIVPRIRITLFSTAADIALCFGALPLTSAISTSVLAAWLVLGAATGLGVICVALYVWLILGIVGD